MSPLERMTKSHVSALGSIHCRTKNCFVLSFLGLCIYIRALLLSLAVVISCHLESDCTGIGFQVTNISQCCVEFQGSSVSFTAAGGTCQPCIREYILHVHVCVSLLAFII